MDARICTHCVEEIPKTARICKHCGTTQGWLGTITRASLVLGFLISVASLATVAVSLNSWLEERRFSQTSSLRVFDVGSEWRNVGTGSLQPQLILRAQIVNDSGGAAQLSDNALCRARTRAGEFSWAVVIQSDNGFLVRNGEDYVLTSESSPSLSFSPPVDEDLTDRFLYAGVQVRCKFSYTSPLGVRQFENFDFRAAVP